MMLRHVVFVCLCMVMTMISCTAQEPVTKAESPMPRKSEAVFSPDAVVRYDERSGCIIRAEGRNLSRNLENDASFRTLRSENRFADIALAFISAYRSAFGISHPSEELKVGSFDVEGSGQKHIRFSQIFEGIPVWASEIIVHLNDSNQVHLVEGRYIPTPSGVSVRPVLSEKDARHIAALDLKQGDCPNCRSGLVIFSDTDAKPHLAYHLHANPGIAQGWEYFIDAQTGEILNKLSAIRNTGTGKILK